MAECSHPSTHPPLPPTTEDDRISWLRLLRSHRIGIQTFFRLLTKHGNAATALEALPDMARASGLGRYQPCSEAMAVKEMILARAAGAAMLCYGDDMYPADLYSLTDPPPLLWAVGNLAALERPRLAIAGARNASSLGLRMAGALAKQLDDEGYCITSGLARGIDTAAHKATVENGSIAVLAGGVDVIYPAENAALAAQMLETGLRLSEQPMGMAPRARHFPKRNRIISGLARALVVIEAGAKSGSLITARAALDQGREVLAVPGHPFDARAAGCNMLIRDGAVLVRTARDVIDALPPAAALDDQNHRPPPRRPLYDLHAISPAPTSAAPNRQDDSSDVPHLPSPAPAPAQTPPPQVQPGGIISPAEITTIMEMAQPQTRRLSDTAALHSQILGRLGPAPLAEDQLIRDLGAPASDVTPVLVELELDGRIERQSGGLLAVR
ncbi:DNA protecting protein DprA [Rhodobacterales bacterium 59_46_T64]|nr:DNA protecting protein DprA [Rhodobacterales bacterium 59_46_T64]